MGKIALEKVMKELKLVKNIAVKSKYWQIGNTIACVS